MNHFGELDNIFNESELISILTKYYACLVDLSDIDLRYFDYPSVTVLDMLGHISNNSNNYHKIVINKIYPRKAIFHIYSDELDEYCELEMIFIFSPYYDFNLVEYFNDNDVVDIFIKAIDKYISKTISRYNEIKNEMLNINFN